MINKLVLLPISRRFKLKYFINNNTIFNMKVIVVDKLKTRKDYDYG